MIRFSLEHAEASWPEVVVASLRLCQSVGHGWTVGYSDHDELDLWGARAGLAHFDVAGIAAIEVQAQPKLPARADHSTT